MSNYLFKDAQNREYIRNQFGKNILVSASAGSGKTSSLTQRAINVLKNKDENGNYYSIDQILLVTFTDAAATEIKERIGSILAKEAKEAETNADFDLVKHLYRQQLLLGQAWISTIHSLCARLIRRYFHLLEIDAKFRLADETESRMLMQDCVEYLFERYYNKKDNDFILLTKWFCSDLNDNALYKAIFDIYKFTCNRIDKEEWLNNCSDQFWPKNAQKITECEWGREFLNYVYTKLEKALCLLEKGIQTGRHSDAMETILQICFNEQNQLRRIKNYKNYSQLRENLRKVKFESWRKCIRNEKVLKNNVEKFDKIKKFINEQRKIIKTLTKNFFQTEEEIIKKNNTVRLIIEKLIEVTKNFITVYALRKKEKSIFDFNDLERYCLKLLTGNNNEPLKDLQNKFVQIFIDEYQDINEVQEAILQKLNGNNFNRFMVGDVKQSIYRFRYAEPTIFLKKYNIYPEHDNANCRKIDLSLNFRSCSKVLKTINFIFEKIMTIETAYINYNESVSLKLGAKMYWKENIHRNALDHSTELHFVCKKNKENRELNIDEEEGDKNDFIYEGQVIADRINEMVSQSKLTYDKILDIWRPIQYKDIAVLFRSSRHISNLVNILRNNGIPSHTNRIEGFFLSFEIKIMISLLSVIDNPLQDIHLVGVLRSPLFEFNNDELAQIRLYERIGYFWDGIQKATESEIENELKNKCLNFIKEINFWRELSRRTSIYELIQDIYETKDFLNYIAVLPFGDVRQANLRLLQDKALQYEQTAYKGLFRFIKYIEELKERKVNLAQGQILSESDNIVRVSTIHSSKGLEYPVVIIGELGRKLLTEKDIDNKLFNLHKQLGIGMKFVDLKSNIVFASEINNLINYKLEQEMIAEEIRILYVAMTRAREKLILVTNIQKKSSLINSVKTKWKPAISIMENEKINSIDIASHKSWLDWIMMALLTDEEALKIIENEYSQGIAYNGWKIFITDTEQIKIKEPTLDHNYIFLKKIASVSITKNILHIVNKMIDWKYPYPQNNNSPKITVSQSKMLNEQLIELEPEQVPSSFFKKKEFLKKCSNTKIVADMEVGLAYHEIFQRLDFNIHNNLEKINNLIENLEKNTIINNKQAKSINILKILGFTKSALANRIKKSTIVKREQSFLLRKKVNGNNMLLQGVIDLFFVEDNKIVIIDFKANNLTAQQIEKKCLVRLNCYAEAIKEITGLKVMQKIIWLILKEQEVIL